MNYLKQFFPEQAGSLSAAVDNIYIFMLAVSLFFTVLVVALVIIFSIQYRKREGRSPVPIHGHLVLELTWTGIPLLITFVMFGWGTYLYFQQMRTPANATEIFVVGKQWMWKIQHGEGPREMNELHVPINQPIKLTMTSEDVIHSFYIPAMRMKADTVPGRYNFMWFKAIKPGKYHLFCAEYCGTKHSEMIGSVYAMEPEDYKKWLTERMAAPTVSTVLSNAQTTKAGETSVQLNQSVSQDTVVVSNSEPLEVRGQRLFQELKCVSCHHASSGQMGPALNGLFGKEVSFEHGGKIKADEAYIRESILNPTEKIVKGYDALMPTYKGQVDEEQILSLVAYIKNLKNNSN